MSDFTYESQNSKARLETYEWDNTWIEHADKQVRRVLYIGDSISCNIRRKITGKAAGELYVDGFGSSKALDNPFFKDAVRLFGAQQGSRAAVLFNNGLHGWHLEDETEYAALYEETVRFLMEEFEGCPLFVVLTTFVADEARHARVLTRNRVAKDVAEKYGLPVIDLYTPAKENAHLLRDGVHFQDEGNQILAETVLTALKEKL